VCDKFRLRRPGLAIVRQIARSRSGDASLSNFPESGLRADPSLTSAAQTLSKKAKNDSH